MDSEEYNRGHAAGASEARKKLAKYLRSKGINIYSSRGNVPEDADFYNGIVSHFNVGKSADEKIEELFIDEDLFPATEEAYEEIDLEDCEL